jgi:hypothetical protein
MNLKNLPIVYSIAQYDKSKEFVTDLRLNVFQKLLLANIIQLFDAKRYFQDSDDVGDYTVYDVENIDIELLSEKMLMPAADIKRSITALIKTDVLYCEYDFESEGVYFIHLYDDYYKIGYGSNALKRVNQIQCQYPENVTVLEIVTTKEWKKNEKNKFFGVSHIEYDFKEKFEAYRARVNSSELFKFNNKTKNEAIEYLRKNGGQTKYVLN